MQKVLRHLTLAGLGAVALTLAATPVAAYPDRPVRIIVPYAPGGATDVVTRILAQHLERELGQSFVVMNVAGGGGAVGWQQGREARADGYTLSLFIDSIPVMEATKAIDFTQEDFEPIALWGTMDITVFASLDGPFETLDDLKAAALAKPGEVGLAMGHGTPSQFVAKLVEDALGVDLNLVNVGGGAQKKAAVLGGHVEAGIEPMPGMADSIGTQFRILAVLGEERPAEFPEIPTAIEQGANVIAYNTYGLIAPKGTPEDRLEILANALLRLADDPGFIEANEKVSFRVAVVNRASSIEQMQAIRARMLDVGQRLGF